MIEKRRLGQSELMVTPLCFGGNVFGWTADEKTSFDLLDRFVAAGFNFVDTADVYSAWAPGNSGGESEVILGKWMKARGNRDKVVLATKLGSPMGEGKKGLSRRYMKEAVEASLQRLQTDYIDLYQSHRDDPDTPIEEVLSSYQDLIKAGKVRAIGSSNFTAARMAEAQKLATEKGLPRYESVQPEYNLYSRQGFEAELGPFCLANHVGVIPYYSLASGFLTGKYRSADDKGQSPRGNGVVGKYLNERGARILAALDETAAETGATPTQVALAWLMARPGLTAPIASASKPAQMGDLLASAELKLPAAAIARLDAASAG